MKSGFKIKRSDFLLPFYVFLFVTVFLAVVQLKLTSNPLILLERFVKGGGWFEIILLAVYGGFIAFMMQNPVNVPKYRRITWTIFSVVFFSQLIIGLLGAQKFLMTGKLHLPIPMMIIAGPVYRGQLSVMTILFISTVVLTGPSWCSQLCYFGAIDNLAAKGKTRKGVIKHKKAIKSTILILVIIVTLILRWIGIPILYSTLIAIGFGMTGLAVMIFFSGRKGKMIHCALYCPVGTVVNLTRSVNPFRMYIDSSCDQCMKCTLKCKFDALNNADVKNKKPNFSCTLCGDCLSACHTDSIKYKFLKMDPERARRLYLFLTISLHTVFLALARI